MKVRQFGMLIVLVGGILPLGAAGLLVVRRAQKTALETVRVGNARVAARLADTLARTVDNEMSVLRTLAASVWAPLKLSPEQADSVVKSTLIGFPYFRSITLFRSTCLEIATSRLDGVPRDRCGEPAVDAALAGRTYRSKVRLGDDFALMMTVGIPLEIAGERVGAAVAELDLVGIWPAVNDLRVGETGYARLVTADDTLIGHGQPEERRRRVFLHEKDPYAAMMRQAGSNGAVYRNSLGHEVIAVAAPVLELGWLLIVEQPVAEAFAAARAMRRDLAFMLAGGILLMIVLGSALVRKPIRAIEAMKRHAHEVARGNLDVRVEVAGLEELGSLAKALNDMADDVKRYQEELRSKERLSTFARVAAGLAHDLQTPIESVRAACDGALRAPGDEAHQARLRSVTEKHLPRLHRYVRDLRRLAHEGTIPLDLSMVDPRTLVNRALAEAAASSKWDGVEFVAEGTASTILVDESLLIRALANLIGNAGDACVMRRPPSGRVSVCVSDFPTDDHVTFAIKDTGVGIPPDRMSVLLSNDFQSSKRASGVGLGLAVARHVAAAHRGTLVGESQFGTGTTFTLTLPRNRSHDAISPPSPSVASHG